MEHYDWRMEDGSAVINQLLNKYSLEGIAMPYTMEQFRKEYVKAHLPEMDADEVMTFGRTLYMAEKHWTKQCGPPNAQIAYSPYKPGHFCSQIVTGAASLSRLMGR